MKNATLVEPYYRVTEQLSSILELSTSSVVQKALELEQLSYEKFIEIKNHHWLKNVSLEWLIQGHISQDEAVSMAKQNLDFISEGKHSAPKLKNNPSIKLN